MMDWCWQWADHTLHVEQNLNHTTAAAHYTNQILYYAFTLPSTKATARYCQRERYHLRTKAESQISSRCKTGNRCQRQTEKTESSFSDASVNPRSSTNRSQLFRLPRRPLVRFPVCFVEPGVHAVHALCPLPVNHSSFLLTVAQTQNADDRSQPLVIDSIGADVHVPPVLDVTLHSVKFFPKHAARFEG